MAVLRDVAVEAGVGRQDRIRTPVARASAIAALVSLLVAIARVLAADAVRRSSSRSTGEVGRWVVEAAALGLPFLALANVWLSATRGLKIMRYTLYVFWAGQPVLWLILMLVGLAVLEDRLDERARVLPLVGACRVPRRGTSGAGRAGGGRRPRWRQGEMGRLFRYAGPRAPAALFSQLLFWTDLFVLTRYASSTEVGVYSAALRAGQMIVLFLTSVSLMFSPYVADLHNRGETRAARQAVQDPHAMDDRSDDARLPSAGRRARRMSCGYSGPSSQEGRRRSSSLLAGQFINIATGSVGFVLIMVGRTGWDLRRLRRLAGHEPWARVLVMPEYGMEGAAIANAVTFAAIQVGSSRSREALRSHPAVRPGLLAAGPPSPGRRCSRCGWFTTVAPGGFLVDLAVTGVVGTAVYLAVYLAAGPDDRRETAASAGC